MTTEDPIGELIRAIETRIRQELRIRCEAYKPDFRAPEVFNVVTALLARQATLAIELASAPQLWNGHSAPLFLRAMTDVHITLSWILLDATTRARQYIDYGLGQAVLAMEHKKRSLDSADGPKNMLEEFIDAQEAWINAQRWTFLVGVKIGAWSGKNTRQMAEEAGILDFYNHVYTPFSQCAHSTWYHVGRYNSAPSDSPLTRQVWMPCIAEAPSDVWNLNLAVKYLDKTFNTFDERALGRAPASAIRDWINSEIEARFPPSDGDRDSAGAESSDFDS